jgi:hypothetical protein
MSKVRFAQTGSFPGGASVREHGGARSFVAGLEDTSLPTGKAHFLRVFCVRLVVWRQAKLVLGFAVPVGVISRERGERVFTPVVDVAAVLAVLAALLVLRGVAWRRRQGSGR